MLNVRQILDYPPDFEAFWTTYCAERNDPKKAALLAWRRTSGARPRDDLIVECVKAYCADLDRQNTGRSNAYRIRKCHAAKWLRLHMWEGYLEAAIYRTEHPAPKIVPRRHFKASIDYPDPLTRPTRTAAQILAQRNGR